MKIRKFYQVILNIIDFCEKIKTKTRRQFARRKIQECLLVLLRVQ